MIVIVSLLNTNVKIKVSVGEGYQSIKWLASVVQTRIANEKLLRHLNILDQVIVKSVKNGRGELLNPSDLILEHRPVGDIDALDVTVDWMEEFQSDAWGHPVYEDWLQAAYMNSECTSKWAFESQIWRESEVHRIARDKEYAQFDDDVDGNPVLARMAMAKRKATVSRRSEEKDDEIDDESKPTGSSLVQIGSDFSAAEIDAAFALDWGNMNFVWYNNMTELNKIAVHDTMKQHYSIICNLFVHYCGMGKVGERWGMSILEFEHLMVLATGRKKLMVQLLVDKVFGAVMQRKPGRSLKKDAAAAAATARRAEHGDEEEDENDHFTMQSMNSRTSQKNIASRTTLKSSATASTIYLEGAPHDPAFWPLLSRQMFAEFVVCFAYMEVQGQTFADISAAQATEQLLTSHLQPFLRTLRTRYLKYTEFDAFTANESYSMLKEFYSKHVTVDPYLGPSFSAPEFEQWMVESQMLIEADNDKEKEQKFSEDAFLWALQCAPRPEQSERKATTGISSYLSPEPVADDGKLGLQDAICFSEFVEALSKLSIITMSTEATLSDVKKIRIGLNFLIEFYVTGSFDGLGGADVSVTRGTTKSTTNGLTKGQSSRSLRK